MGLTSSLFLPSDLTALLIIFSLNFFCSNFPRAISTIFSEYVSPNFSTHSFFNSFACITLFFLTSIFFVSSILFEAKSSISFSSSSGIETTLISFLETPTFSTNCWIREEILPQTSCPNFNASRITSSAISLASPSTIDTPSPQPQTTKSNPPSSTCL